MSSAPSPPFATTRWSMVAAAGQTTSAESRRALAELCEIYWYPLYAFVRRKGWQVEEAQDLTQAFFAELLEKERLRLADQGRGKFRSFLLASLSNFLNNQWRRDSAQKRGGETAPLALDFASGEQRYGCEPAHDWTPERIFERRWAMTLLDTAVRRLHDEYERAGKRELFEGLKGHLGGDDKRVPFNELSRQLGASPNALKVAAHRLRKRCGELLREEIAETVAAPEDIEAEMQALFQAVSAE